MNGKNQMVIRMQCRMKTIGLSDKAAEKTVF